jgi:threonine synthase
LGNGATVFEIPGVFDDCMKVVEKLSEEYTVALLNSKNAWRILGQESYSYEIAQDLEYDLRDTAVIVPIGNAGNITAVMNGFIKFFKAGIITTLPKIIGIQSEHADPVYRYYQEPDPAKRHFKPIAVKPSVAQAAMIGNPVSMPRVIALAEQYNQLADEVLVYFCQVSEQDIMDWQLVANRNGHIVCTHGGECLAGLVSARQQKILGANETVILDSTAHALKFSGFQHMYFEDSLPGEYNISPKEALQNKSILVKPQSVTKFPSATCPLEGDALSHYVDSVSREIAFSLNLKKREP